MKVSFRKIVVIYTIGFFFVGVAMAGNFSSQLRAAFSSADSYALSEMFNDNVMLSLQNANSIYSKNQARQILSAFFSKHPPTGFKENNSGGTSEARFILGILFTKSGEFNVSILLRGKEGNRKIHQLSIQKENGF